MKRSVLAKETIMKKKLLKNFWLTFTVKENLISALSPTLNRNPIVIFPNLEK